VEFLMGSPADEPGRSDDERQHRRKIGRSYALATKAVTVAQFERFRKENPKAQLQVQIPNQWGPEPDRPVSVVSWYDAVQYCRWLSEKEGVPAEQMCYPPLAEIEKSKDGKTPLRLPADYLQRTGYRLPTEAEWEHACRAGTRTAWSCGEAAGLVDRYAWHLTNSEQRFWPVGQKRPNDLGLFDMHGNVWQWCQNVYQDYKMGIIDDKEDIKDIKNPHNHLLRGGMFYSQVQGGRSASRTGNAPAYRLDLVGFRPARTYR
jgi:formylglycine-generating enzyme required for sulfatase activity